MGGIVPLDAENPVIFELWQCEPKRERKRIAISPYKEKRMKRLLTLSKPIPIALTLLFCVTVMASAWMLNHHQTEKDSALQTVEKYKRLCGGCGTTHAQTATTTGCGGCGTPSNHAQAAAPNAGSCGCAGGN